MLLGVSHKMLRKILSQVFNYDRKSSRVEAQSIGRPRSATETLASTEPRSDESSRGVHSGSNKTKVFPFPDPWDGDWNDAVINWALWHENTKREGEGKESPEVGETETN